MREEGREIAIPLGAVSLGGTLTFSGKTGRVVLFSHGSGSSRHSPRNQFVAHRLQEEGIGTLLFDLLTLDEDARYENRFNIDLLTDRLTGATRWMMAQCKAGALFLGYFGASTGAASALNAAAQLGPAIRAVVSRGGRPDLAAGAALERVQAATLLIVGGNDAGVIELNREAYDQLNTDKEIAIIPGATHLFEELGALEEVAQLAAAWFNRYLV